MKKIGRCAIVEHSAGKAAGKLLQPLFGTIADTLVDAFSRRADEIYKG